MQCELKRPNQTFDLSTGFSSTYLCLNLNSQPNECYITEVFQLLLCSVFTHLTDLQLEEAQCQGAWLLCSEIHQHFCSQSCVPLVVQPRMSTGGMEGSPIAGGHTMALVVRFAQGLEESSWDSTSVWDDSIQLSLPSGSVTAVWPVSQYFRASSPFSLTAISPNKILACLFLSWCLLPKAPRSYSL